MTLPAKSALAFLLMTGTALAEERTLLGGVDARTYGNLTDATAHEITDIELRTNANSRVASHEVVVRSSPLREVIFCSLYDAAGETVATKSAPSNGGGRSLFFMDYVPDATARCYYIEIERLTRPPTGGVVVNRLVSITP